MRNVRIRVLIISLLVIGFNSACSQVITTIGKVADAGLHVWIDAKDGGGDREMHFSLRNGVEVIGGYKGEGDVNNPVLYKTVLSGDIGTENDYSDNVYHVFYHPDGTKLDATARLKGVRITKGNADGSVPINSSGGGMFNDYSSPRLTDCEFTDNKTYWGGGMYNVVNSFPTLVNCTFTDNEASYVGGNA